MIFDKDQKQFNGRVIIVFSTNGAKKVRQS